MITIEQIKKITKKQPVFKKEFKNNIKKIEKDILWAAKYGNHSIIITKSDYSERMLSWILNEFSARGFEVKERSGYFISEISW